MSGCCAILYCYGFVDVFKGPARLHCDCQSVGCSLLNRRRLPQEHNIIRTESCGFGYPTI